MYTVSVEKMVEKFELTNLTPEISYEGREISQSDVNRPALQLAGFFDHFDDGRLQVIGKVEDAYLETMSLAEREERFRKLLSFTSIPCIVICRSLGPYPDLVKIANKNQIPVFHTEEVTSSFIAEANRWLHVELAERKSVHGVLVDIYGEGVLIKGESGIGKSETALELIRRGHRLVADDVVEIKKVSAATLLGTSPEVICHFIEMRGIGIVDIKQIFGVGSVKQMQNIDLIINLELWDQQKEYDRLGIGNKYEEILGIDVVSHTIPIRPGRNIAIICETAAINFRQKKMGYNAAEELNKRVLDNLQENASKK